jgi:hypothetical protein
MRIRIFAAVLFVCLANPAYAQITIRLRNNFIEEFKNGRPSTRRSR